MRILLDTSAWLWMVGASERLGGHARTHLEDPDNELLLSAASSWEIAIKHGIGKLSLPDDPGRYVPARMAATGVTPLRVTYEHALAVAALPHHHSDPFDRLLIAQAAAERVPVMTDDGAFAAYDVDTIAAGS